MTVPYVAFVKIEPIISQIVTDSYTDHMVKHCSDHLRYFLINVADYVFVHKPIFAEFYYKNRNEGK